MTASIRRLRAIGSVDFVDAHKLAFIIAHRMNTTTNMLNYVVFVEERRVYSTPEDSDYALVVKAPQIVGTYTRTAGREDIAADIEAWREAA